MTAESSERTYTIVDKSAWGDGPWQQEPDWIAWIDGETAFPCMIVRGPLGTLNGYVGVAINNDAFGHSLDDLSSVLSIHGGVTYAEPHQPGSLNPEYSTIEQIEGLVGTWWIGFDTGHWNDVTPVQVQLPALVAALSLSDILGTTSNRGEYRTVAFVRAECLNLAGQLSALEDGP